MRVMLTLSGNQRAVAAEAQAAEAQGYAGIAAGEHLFFHGPVTNAFVSLAAAAGATSRIRLLSSVSVLPLYPAALAAKLATTVDQVSNGRFDLGVGIGGEYPPEFVAAAADVAERGARADESLRLLQALWTRDAVDFDGRFTRLPGLTLEPGPVQAGGPPIWLGGRKAAAIRRAARHADVWMPYMYTPEQLAESLAQVRATAAEMGRDPATIRGAVFVWGGTSERASESRREVVEAVSAIYQQDFSPLADRYLLHGDPDRVLARAREYADAGAETLVLSPVGDGARRSAIVDLFTSSVLPGLRSFAATSRAASSPTE